MAVTRDIKEAHATRLSSEEFDCFCELLEQPVPKAFRELIDWEPEWVQRCSLNTHGRSTYDRPSAEVS